MTLNNLAKDYLACIVLHLYIMYSDEKALDMHTHNEANSILFELDIKESDFPRLTDLFIRNNYDFRQLVERLSSLVIDKDDRQYCNNKIQIIINGGLEYQPTERLKILLTMLLMKIGEKFYN